MENRVGTQWTQNMKRDLPKRPHFSARAKSQLKFRPSCFHILYAQCQELDGWKEEFPSPHGASVSPVALSLTVCSRSLSPPSFITSLFAHTAPAPVPGWASTLPAPPQNLSNSWATEIFLRSLHRLVRAATYLLGLTVSVSWLLQSWVNTTPL